jgi:TPR repeat protein
MGAEVILKLNRMPATPAPDPIAAAERVLAKYDPTDDASGFLNASMQLVGLLTTGGEPASPEHVKLLDHVLTGLRNKAPVLGGDEFSDYKDNFLVAAHRDILPAILVMADNLKAANSTEAFGWYYYAAAVKHDSYAMRSLAWLYWLGECGVKPDKQTGFNWFKQAYVAGDTMAGAILGNCYLRGDGTARDEDAGISVLLPLANDGVADAQTLIGECYYYGYGQFGALTQDERNRKAIEFFKDAIAGKDWAACGHLGVLYETGEGVPKDWKEAARLYLQGVNNQNPVCMYYYARAIETHGAEISKVFGRNDNAESYYRMAAAAGIADARAWCMEHKVQF